jgi:hypothetical protein
MGVLQAGDNFDFPKEAVGSERADYFRPKHLDRDLARMLQVPGEVDRGHAAATQLALDRIAVGEARAQQGQRFSCVAHKSFHRSH